jgi:superfamily I DNA and/or RNA helicase
MKLMQKITEAEQTIPHLTAFISPYSAQITLAKNMLTPEYEISTIDSFQGREKHTILLSLVRSNTDGEIGFLKDYRRMNVAITRAKEKLIIVGDSSTIGNDRFYSELITYVEKNGEYKTCWDYPELFN